MTSTLLLAAVALAQPEGAEAIYADAAIVLRQETRWRYPTEFDLGGVPDPGEEDVDLYLYRGPDRLDVPAFLSLVGEHDRAVTLEARIRRDRRTAGWLFSVGGVGALTAIVGIAGLERVGASGDDVRKTNLMLFAGGSIAMTAGFLGGSIPATRSRRLNRRPLATLEIQELLGLQRAYNRRLREDLGLEPVTGP